MSAEATARKYAENLETYLLERSNIGHAALGKEITDLISNLKTTPWEDIYYKTMIYRILSDEERLSTIKSKLSFLTDAECSLVKQHIDYIILLAEH